MSSWRSGYCYLNKGECNFNQSKHDSFVFLLDGDLNKSTGCPRKKYSCLIKHKMHNKTEIFEIEIFLDYQLADLSFDMLVLIFGCHLAEI